MLSTILRILAGPEPSEESGQQLECDRPIRVLLAEDNAVNRRVATRLLEKRGHEVVAAADGIEALALLDRHEVGLVLMDLHMPVMDGLRSNPNPRRNETATGRRVPIVAMTAFAMDADRERWLAAGMEGYLSKPSRPANCTR